MLLARCRSSLIWTEAHLGFTRGAGNEVHVEESICLPIALSGECVARSTVTSSWHPKASIAESWPP